MYGNITFWSEKNGFVAISSIKDLSDGNQRNEEIVALAEYLFYIIWESIASCLRKLK